MALLAAGCGQSITPEEFADIAAEARTCEAGDSCVLAGSGQCTCPQPVNAADADRVDEAAQDVDCMGAVVSCVGFDNPRCEDEVCTADIQ